MALRMRTLSLLALGCAWGASGCDAFGTPIEEGSSRFVPTDTRPVQRAAVTLPPIIGGTLAIAGNRAVVADPDRDRVSIVDLATRTVIGQVDLDLGDEPGRIAIDGDGVAHVALRRRGQVVAIDTANATLLRRADVCGAPRGVAYDASTDRIHVACAGGDLVSLSAADEREQTRARLEPDLRDVIVRNGQLQVSRFKSAEALRVAMDGTVVGKSRAATVLHSGIEKSRVFEPAIAWRTVPDTSGDGVVIVHQRAQSDEVVVDRRPDPQIGGSPYGGGGTPFDFGPTCDGIVHSAVTIVGSNGQMQTTAGLPDVVLGVDAAVSSQFIAIAVAGPADPGAPRAFTVSNDDDGPTFGGSASTQAGAGGVVLVSRSSLMVTSGVTSDPTVVSGCAQVTRVGTGSSDPSQVATPEQVTAVAFAPNGELVYQTREPATLAIVDRAALFNGGIFGGVGVTARIELGGDSVMDTGHDIFHRDSGGGIACASCHAEGGDDGHVWQFNTIGQRRTQQVNIGLEGTEPFHWDGDMTGIHEIMDDVFVGRMGGVRQSEDRLAVMSEWLFEQAPPAAIRSADDPAAVRGHALFDSREVGCANCHTGAKLTNNLNAAVGTGELGQRFQVPSLVGIGYRAPFIHTGCAPTLRDRFTDTECAGGDAHGVTSRLSEAQIDDLVAYLETL